MKIAYISIENPYSYNNGGIGTYTGMIAEAMAAKNNEVHLITLGKNDEDYVHSGVNVHCISDAFLSKRLFYLEESFLIYERINGIVRSNHIDIVESPEWLAQGLFTVTECNIPFITRLHTPLFIIEDVSKGQRIYRDSDEIKRYELLQAKRSTLLTAPCNSMREWINDEWGIDSWVIYNPIDETKYTLCDNTENTVLFMGRLEYRKGITFLSESIKKLARDVQNVKIIICGRDSIFKKESMQKRIMRECEDVIEHIQFISHASYTEKKELFSKAKVVVLPSVWENQSYVCLEAMASGKTVIATNTGGFLDMINNNESGYLVDAGNSEQLYERMKEVLTDKIPGTGKNARRVIEEKFSTNVLVDEYIRLYESVL